jgi:ligand-binding sensor domain-containing protein
MAAKSVSSRKIFKFDIIRIFAFISIIVASLFTTTSGQVAIKGMAPSYVKYGEEDGLPSSNIYFCYEDYDHTIWFSTDNGVSRFDGINFVNYTIDNGLADNEIFSIYQDTKSRIWFLSYSGVPSYYFGTEFFNPRNESKLSAVKPGNFLSSIYEDKIGNIYIGSKNGLIYKVDYLTGRALLFWSSSDASVYSISQNNSLDLEIFFQTNKLLTVGTNQQEVFVCDSSQFLYPPRVAKLRDGKIVVGNGSSLIYFGEDHIVTKTNFQTIATNSAILNVQQDRDGNVWISTTNGVFVTDSNFSSWQSFLEGKSITSAMKDHEGGTWFTSKEGVFYFPNTSLLCLEAGKEHSQNSATAIAFDSEKWVYVGYLDGKILKIDANNLAIREQLELPRIDNHDSKINDIFPLESGNVLISSYLGSFRLSGQKLERCTKLNVKKIRAVSNSGKGCICHSFGWNLIDLQNCSRWGDPKQEPKDPQDRKRCLDISITPSGMIWIANSNGLVRYSYANGVQVRREWLADVRIKCIETDPKGGLWIGTTGKGLLRVSLNGIQFLIPPGEGGGSSINSIRFTENETALISSSNGIMRIRNYQNINRNRLQYSWVGKEDGLPSEKVSDAVLIGDNIWAATMRGAVVFDQNLFDRRVSPPITVIDHILVDFEEFGLKDRLNLRYYENSIGLGFVGISFNSMGEIEYRYRMNGLDSTWRYSKRNFVEYPDLPPGKFQFEVQSRSRKGGWSKNVANLQISIETPFWRQAWFWIFAPAFVFLAIIFILLRRIAGIAARNKVERRAIEAEQTLLMVQMNPHFIFNALNSIQRYFFSGESEKANDYLIDFGQLIRMMLEHCRRPLISLKEEVEFIEKYLKIESLRLENRIIIDIYVQSGLYEGRLLVPPMLLQPFIENAIWHGIVPKAEGGTIRVQFFMETGYLNCIIEDDGIGRDRSRELKSETESLHHRSLAIQITNDRIQLLNFKRTRKLSLEIFDLFIEGVASGTKVVFRLPVD